MKILVTTFVIASAASALIAQEPASQAPRPVRVHTEVTTSHSPIAREFGAQSKVIAELAAAHGHSLQKNSPLSAEEVNESVQTLADGNRIVRNSTGKFYRNSEGRIRREGSGGVGGVLGTNYAYGQGVSIVNPVVGQKYLLDSELKMARVIEMGQNHKELAIAGARLGTTDAASSAEAQRARELLGKVQNAGKPEVRASAPLNMQGVPGFATTINGSGQNGFFFSTGTSAKYETSNEDLGTRDFEGISAEGNRRTTTIPAAAIGNERPIEIVYERWFSKEIGMVVYSKNNDPRFGEQIYKLTNIVRSEPDPSLFAVPTEYKKFSENGTLYKVSSASPSLLKAPIPARTVIVAKPAMKPIRP